MPGPAPNPVFCALDTPDLTRAVELARAVGPHVGGLKLGLEFFCANGPEGVRRIADLGQPVFLDLKLHDIPNTVQHAAKECAALGAGLLTVHALGGRAMIEAARTGCGEAATKVLAVTILTSHSEDVVREQIGLCDTSAEAVPRLAKMAIDAGAHGIVCSPLEASAVRAAVGSDAVIVTPGVRPAGSDVGDQKRIAAPLDAKRAGADFIVVGRPVTAAPDPGEAARRILEELSHD